MAQPLRIGVSVDTLSPPRFIVDVLTGLAGDARRDLAVLVVGGAAPPSQSSLFALYRSLDDLVASGGPGLLEAASLAPGDTPVLMATPGEAFAPFPKDFSGALARYNLDVFIHLGTRTFPSGAKIPFRFGAWSFSPAEYAAGRSGAAGLDEMAHSRDVARAAVIADLGKKRGKTVLAEAAEPTNMASLRRTQESVCAALGGALCETLDHAARTGRLPDPGTVRDFFGGDGAPRAGTGDMLRFFGLAGFKAVRRLLFKAGISWTVAYTFENGEGLLPDFSNAAVLTASNGRFLADPFPVERDGAYWIFAEEYIPEKRRARLAAVPIDEHGAAGAPVPVLEKPHHLSYPHVFAYGDELLMVPESMDNETIDLYRCTSFPGEWEHAAALFSDVRAVDTNIIEVDGIWWLFTTMASEKGDDYEERLHLFYADSPYGPWRAHAGNPVKIDPAASRGAGRLFFKNEKLHRPAQDCSTRYGYRVVVHEVTELSPETFEERVAAVLSPDWRPGLKGTHTFNTAGGLSVTDGYRYTRTFRWKRRAG